MYMCMYMYVVYDVCIYVCILSCPVGDKRYTKAHEWVSLDDPHGGTVGISNYAQQELGDVVYVELPEKGKKFQRGDTFASVESTKAASSVYAPVDISVNDTNEEVVENTALVNEAAE